jgi:MFS family permease
MVGGLAALGNGVGRVFWGKMADKVGFFKGYATTTLLQILLLLLLPLTASSRLAFGSAICATISLSREQHFHVCVRQCQILWRLQCW